MNYKLFRRATAVWTVVLFTAVTVSELHAVDNKGRSVAYGVGQRTCADYVKFREKKLETLEKHERYTKDELYEIVDKIVEHWIAGFLTAHNLYVTDTYDVIGNVSMDEVKVRLEKSCRANGKQYFAEAVITLVQELHPQRAKAATGK